MRFADGATAAAAAAAEALQCPLGSVPVLGMRGGPGRARCQPAACRDRDWRRRGGAGGSEAQKPNPALVVRWHGLLHCKSTHMIIPDRLICALTMAPTRPASSSAWGVDGTGGAVYVMAHRHYGCAGVDKCQGKCSMAIVIEMMIFDDITARCIASSLPTRIEHHMAC